MNTQREGLLSVIKTLTLNRHLAPLLELPQPEQSLKKNPFELYQYEQEQLGFEEEESRIMQDILFTLNQHLYEQEQSKLKMELFSIQEHVQMEEHQIYLLKLQIEEQQRAERINAVPPSQITTSLSPKNETANKEETILKQRIQTEQRESRLNIFPCVRVDFEPPKLIPRLRIHTHADKQTHAKSHRQLLATYTKRSQGSNARLKQPEEDKNITIKDTKSNSQAKGVAGIQHKIAFIERAWKKAKGQKRKELCKEYKKELMDLVGKFWIAI